MNYFSEEFGGPNFLELTLNGLKIATPVEDYIMANDPVYYYEILNLRHAPEGEADADLYYDLWTLLTGLSDADIAMFEAASSGTGEKCCFKDYRA